MTIYEDGIDVSSYQGQVDWAAVREAGKQFALIRLGFSNSSGSYLDPLFSSNLAGAQAAGLKAGAYYYTYAKTQQQVIDELETFLPALQGKKLEYPVFVDVEDNSLTTLNPSTLTGLVQFAMDILNQKGWLPGYYTYSYFAQNQLATASLGAYPLWIADYRGYVGYQGPYSLWQYSSSGRVAGIENPVDLNYSYEDFLPILKAQGLNGFEKEELDPCTSVKAQLAQREVLLRQTKTQLEGLAAAIGTALG